MVNSIGRQKQVSEQTQLTSVANTDFLLGSANVSGNTVTFIIQTGNLFSNVPNLSVLNFVITKANTPANSSAITVSNGTIWADSYYLYVATSNNFVKRLSLETF